MLYNIYGIDTERRIDVVLCGGYRWINKACADLSFLEQDWLGDFNQYTE